MKSKLLIILLSFGLTLSYANTALATFQNMNECVYDHFCKGSHEDGIKCNLKWNNLMRSCVKHYDFYTKNFRYEHDYMNTTFYKKSRIKQILMVEKQLKSLKLTSTKDKKMKKVLLKSLNNELKQRRQQIKSN